MEWQIAVTLWDDGRQHDPVFIQTTSRCVRSVCRSFLQTHTEGDKLSHTPWCEMSPGKAQPTGKSSAECHRDTQSKLLKQCGEEMAVTFTVCVCLSSASVHAGTCLFESVCYCRENEFCHSVRASVILTSRRTNATSKSSTQRCETPNSTASLKNSAFCCRTQSRM